MPAEVTNGPPASTNSRLEAFCSSSSGRSRDRRFRPRNPVALSQIMQENSFSKPLPASEVRMVRHQWFCPGWCVLACLAPVCAAGCGSSDLVPVSGQVKLDGKLLEAGAVTFHPD